MRGHARASSPGLRAPRPCIAGLPRSSARARRRRSSLLSSCRRPSTTPGSTTSPRGELDAEHLRARAFARWRLGSVLLFPRLVRLPDHAAWARGLSRRAGLHRPRRPVLADALRRSHDESRLPPAGPHPRQRTARAGARADDPPAHGSRLRGWPGMLARDRIQVDPAHGVRRHVPGPRDHGHEPRRAARPRRVPRSPGNPPRGAAPRSEVPGSRGGGGGALLRDRTRPKLYVPGSSSRASSSSPKGSPRARGHAV